MVRKYPENATYHCAALVGFGVGEPGWWTHCRDNAVSQHFTSWLHSIPPVCLVPALMSVWPRSDIVLMGKALVKLLFGFA